VAAPLAALRKMKVDLWIGLPLQLHIRALVMLIAVVQYELIRLSDLMQFANSKIVNFILLQIGHI